MRLRRLGLPRYGIFTGREIDFGQRRGGPDLHIIYGPNEAGKSTALTAFLDLLFGIEHRTPYSFIHRYDAMRVEADLEIGGDVRHLARVKRRQHSLLDRGNQPVADGIVANAVGGMDRESYKAMFSLDDDTLEAGGEAILRSEGNLGELLFAGGAGLVELGATLDRLRKLADSFHKKRARATRLVELKKGLGELRERKKALDVDAGEFTRRKLERDRTRADHDAACRERAELETRRDALQGRIHGLPWLAEIKRLRCELSGLADLPEVPEHWPAQLPSLMKRRPWLEAEVESLARERQGLAEKVAVLPDNTAILALQGRIEQLDIARSRHMAAEDDLPRRRTQFSEYEGKVAAIRQRLPQVPGDGPEALVIRSDAAGRLRELIDRRSRLDEQMMTAAAELRQAEEAEETARQVAEGFHAGGAEDQDCSGSAFDRLNATVEVARDDDAPHRLRQHTQARDTLSLRLGEQMAALQPRPDRAEALAAIRAPERGEIENWRNALQQAAAALQGLDRERAQLQAACEKLQGQITVLTAKGGVIDDAAAAELRTLRDEAWQQHRMVLDTESADAFERRMRQDDDATQSRFSHATDVAALRQAKTALRGCEAELVRNASERESADAQRQQVRAGVALVAADIAAAGVDGFPTDIGPDRLAGWFDRRAEILETLAEVRREDREAAQARADAAQHVKQLSAALTGALVPHDPRADLPVLIRIAFSAVAEERERRSEARNAQQHHERARADATRRRRECERLAGLDAEWRAAWADALSQCWLGKVEPVPDAPAMREILDEVRDLEAAAQERDGLADRITKMAQDQHEFAAELRELAGTLAEPFDERHAVAFYDTLKTRLHDAFRDREEGKELRGEIARNEKKMQQAKAQLDEIDAAAKVMFILFGVDSLTAVAERIRNSERRAAARAELADREAKLVDVTKMPSCEEAEAALAELDREALERDLAEIRGRIEDAGGRTNELYLTAQRAEDALRALGGDNAAAQIASEQRTLILEIEERAGEWLRLRLGINAAERALEVYREKHRSSMMERASQAFRTVSRGAYSRLEAQWTDRGEVLLGIDAQGRAKNASELSKGTRFQLYLALRVAGYREFAEQHGAVPFIADDILETFDDFRAEEAFRLFAEMAEVGQVVYLSHHRHLCRIAREVCPSASIHELPGPALATADITSLERRVS